MCEWAGVYVWVIRESRGWTGGYVCTYVCVCVEVVLLAVSCHHCTPVSSPDPQLRIGVGRPTHSDFSRGGKTRSSCLLCGRISVFALGNPPLFACHDESN